MGQGAGARTEEQECDLWRGALTDFLCMPRISRENSADGKPISSLCLPLCEERVLRRQGQDHSDCATWHTKELNNTHNTLGAPLLLPDAFAPVQL